MESAYEEIKYNGELIAIILRSNFTSKETVFFSAPEFSQQMGYIVYPKGGVIKAHAHKKVDRKVFLTQEVLFIKKGRLQVDFFTNNRKPFDTRELQAGDTIFLCSGGHGFRILEDAEMIEVKQGPYSGRESDKEIFEGVENDSSK
ncbi:MAG: hypothetical protein NT099_06960 [Candidatus Saganbacteria bacterium]|nr:hypothetical protein [Candidatus Saganbacteria bacterium]